MINSDKIGENYEEKIEGMTKTRKNFQQNREKLFQEN